LLAVEVKRMAVSEVAIAERFKLIEKAIVRRTQLGNVTRTWVDITATNGRVVSGL
jgi:hypothetical protein